MTETPAPPPPAPAPAPALGRFGLLARALRQRTTAVMLGLGFASGLPFALLIGTLNAWLGEAGIKMATIGVLSWIGLAYAFKFLWSPLVDRGRLPLLARLGPRRSWIMLAQGVLALALVALALTNPVAAIPRFALLAFIAALASATQDVAIDAWRIDAASPECPIELLSSVGQLGYRLASLVGGAGALMLASVMGWREVYLVMAALAAAAPAVTALATDRAASERSADADAPAVARRTRLVALGVVLAGWVWAVATLVGFMARLLAPVSGAPTPDVSLFTRTQGPLIVLATVVLPLVVAAVTARARPAAPAPLAFADPLYGALVAPLVDLVARLGWGVLSVIALILSYSLCYNLWASFAFPFYLGFLHYSKEEVAFASKLFGVVMTIAGIGLGGALFARAGRMPTVLLGALLPIAGNLVYADLARGGAGVDRIATLIGWHPLFGLFGIAPRLARLLLAISIENIATGLAGAAFVAWLSGIINRRFAAVQYALLSSLVFLVGGLGRGLVGAAIDRSGYAAVFDATALAGLVAVAAVGIEWLRVMRKA